MVQDPTQRKLHATSVFGMWVSVAGPILGILVIVAAGGFALLNSIASDQDRAWADKSSRLVERSMTAKLDELATLSDDYAVWDAGYRFTSLAWDQAQVEESYYNETLEVVAVIGADRSAPYVWRSEKASPRKALLDSLIAAGALEKAVAAHIAAGSQKQDGARQTLLDHQGMPVIISTSRIRPLGESTLKVGPSDKRYYITLVKLLDGESLSATAGLTGLSALTYQSGPLTSQGGRGQVSYAIQDSGGRELGHLIWPHERPGSADFASRLGVIGAGLVLIGLMGIAVGGALVAAQMRIHDAAREAAEDASRMKSQFLANMSHELRTPLNSVIGFSEIIQEDAAEAGVHGTVADAGRITKAARHLLALINDLLDHSKIEAGKLELCLEPAPLRPMLEDVVESVTRAAAGNGNSVILRCDPDLGSAQLDTLRFKQCLLNLASNAVKFTKDGAVTISARAVDMAGVPSIRVSIADTGIGMSEQTLNNLFQPFVQADGTTTRNFGGTGLGLVITKNLIEAMGGSIEVRSAPGQGAKFTIILPRGNLAADHGGKAPPSSATRRAA